MTFWDDERLATMIQMRDAGYPASRIANALGCTKNTVVGKCNRMFGEGPTSRYRVCHWSSDPKLFPLSANEKARRCRLIALARAKKRPAPVIARAKIKPAVAKLARQELSKPELRALFESAWANTAKQQEAA